MPGVDTRGMDTRGLDTRGAAPRTSWMRRPPGGHRHLDERGRRRDLPVEVLLPLLLLDLECKAGAEDALGGGKWALRCGLPPPEAGGPCLGRWGHPRRTLWHPGQLVGREGPGDQVGTPHLQVCTHVYTPHCAHTPRTQVQAMHTHELGPCHALHPHEHAQHTCMPNV